MEGIVRFFLWACVQMWLVSQCGISCSSSSTYHMYTAVSPQQENTDTKVRSGDVPTMFFSLTDLDSNVHEIKTVFYEQETIDLASETAIQPSPVSNEYAHQLSPPAETAAQSDFVLAMSTSVAMEYGDGRWQSQSPSPMTGIADEQNSLRYSAATEPGSTGPPLPDVSCEAFVCKTLQGVAINTTNCTLDTSQHRINVTRGLAVEIVSGSSSRYIVNCTWELVVPKEKNALITFDPIEAFEGNWTISVSEVFWDKTVLRAVVSSTLQAGVNVSSQQNVKFLHNGEHLRPVTFRVTLFPNVLPSKQLSSTEGFVTSPGFLAASTYPVNYDGSFDINVPENNSVVLRFIYLEMGVYFSTSFCYFAYLTINEVDRNNGNETAVWTGCYKPSSVHLYRSSIRLRFVSDTLPPAYDGFVLMYTVLPSDEVSSRVSKETYNCSVPYFSLSTPPFTCDNPCQGKGNDDLCSHSLLPLFVGLVRVCGSNLLLCQVAPDVYFTFSPQCSTYSIGSIEPISEVTAVHVVASPWSALQSQTCRWYVNVPKQYFLLLTFLQPSNTEGHDSITVYDSTETVRLLQFRFSEMTHPAVNITSLTRLIVDYATPNLKASPPFTFQVVTFPNILPSSILTENAGTVTSPGFSFGQHYPPAYDGTLDIHVPVNFSVLVKVAYMSINASYDTLRIYTINQNNSNDTLALELTGINVHVPLKSFHSAIKVRFTSNYTETRDGFKIVYAILPINMEPEQLNESVYNCSVPHADLFMPLFRCNFLQECEANEDETGCRYSGRCSAGALEAGTKCYSRSRLSTPFTWYDTRSRCRNEKQSMISLPTFDSWKVLQKLAYDFYIFDVFVGLQLGQWSKLAAPLLAIYKNIWQWSDTWAALSVNITSFSRLQKETIPMCAITNFTTGKMQYIRCFEYQTVDLLCELDIASGKETNSKTLSNTLALENSHFRSLGVTSCPAGHVTRDFLSCDTASQCNSDVAQSCGHGSNGFPAFQCSSRGQAVPYSLVCDHISHCDDNSDENSCMWEQCTDATFLCRNKQCVRMLSVCNGKMDCTDYTDEICQSPSNPAASSIPPPARVDFSPAGSFSLTASDTCPSTHFQCLDGYCLPVYLRCNGIADCTELEDERECDLYTCPGYYRCRGSTICLHPNNLCDGVFQCPQCDDELVCKPVVCPQVCRCQGLSFVCTSALPANFSSPQLRYLDVSGTAFVPQVVSNSWYLITLAVSNVKMTRIPTLALPNLRQLDLSNNDITFVDFKSFNSLTNLEILILRGNPLDRIAFTFPSTRLISKIQSLKLSQIDMSHTNLEIYNGSDLANCANLTSLNISKSKLRRITEEGFTSTPRLEHLDIRGHVLTDYPLDALKNLSRLKTVYTDNFVLCCQAMLPEGFDVSQCHTKENLLASCEDLLRNNAYRVFLWIIATLAVVGNLGSFVGRFYLGKAERKLGSFSVFVTNLSIADFCMGVYLSIVGVADLVYRGEYLRHNKQWKKSVMCSLAGVLSQLSSEVSAFIICLITLDRLLVICFPFSQHVHFQKRSALTVCIVTWLTGIALASVPLLPATSHWEYYSQTGICIPLPFSTADDFPGYSYSLGVMIILNFVLFMLIAVGQLIIYCSIRRNTLASSKSSVAKQATVARRLTTIVLSDFLCWFPIGLLGMLAATGTPISGEVNVAVAILVLPFNSALNPFLYTFNTLMEKKQKSLENKLLKRLERSLQTDRSTAVCSAAARAGEEANANKVS